MIAKRKQWDDEYLAQAIADEIELGWAKMRRRFTAPIAPTMSSDLLPGARRGAPMVSAGASRLTFSAPEPVKPPHWRRDWSAAGPLLAQLGLSVRHDTEEGTVSVGTGNRRRDVTEAYRDHPGADEATVAAIVRAATQAFNEARESA
jgi:hypothetical protein